MPAGICTKIIMPTRAGRAFPCSWVSVTQRGHRLGQTISGLFKQFVIPFVAPRVKEGGKKILGNVVKTGMEMVGDVVSGRSAKESLKERGLAGIKRTITDLSLIHISEPTRPY